jgi:DNA-binding transcriptional MerR regulator
MKKEIQKFSLDELCALVDLPRRTIRFYMQHGLVDRPEGSGRGAHYTSRHVEQLLSVKKWKQAGLSLERIGELTDGEIPVPLPPVRPGQVDVWSRVHIADGVELHIEPRRTELNPEQLRALIREIMAAYQQIQQEEDG